jgi:predicted flavoprotein YhiN
MELDLKPAVAVEKIAGRFSEGNRAKNLSTFLRGQIKLSKSQLLLLKSLLTKEDFLDPRVLSRHIKHLEIQVTGLGPVTEAISTVGGIALDEVNENFELHKLKHHYCIGEMLDYDAPTGGYLLQSCFSMAKYLAHQLNG